MISRPIQDWLSLQAIAELTDWLPWAPDMNPIENMWSEVKRTMQENWPVLPLKNSDELWTLVSDAWDEVALSKHYIQSLIESWLDEWNQWSKHRGSGLFLKEASFKTALSRAKVLILILYT